MEAKSWSVSRAGEGKNESSAGRRVIIAKGSKRAGQGTMPLAVDIGELQLGSRYNGSMWATQKSQRKKKKTTQQPRAAQSSAEFHGDGGQRWDAIAVRI